ncbi:MAG: hypothetical protein ACKVRP_13480 [Bacteroidota bacterium]
MKSVSFFLLILLFVTQTFSQIEKSIIGTWFYFEPAKNKIMSSNSEYTSYTFYSDGKVISKTLNKQEKGTYSINRADKKVIANFDYGDGDINLVTFKVDSDGKTRIIYRANLKTNIGFEDNLLYVKENSGEWNKRKKSKEVAKTLDRFPDAPKSLKIGSIYLLPKDVPLAPELYPEDYMEAISEIQKLFAGSKITITERAMKEETVWYKIAGFNTLTNEVISGWINSAALSGEKLVEVKD